MATDTTKIPVGRVIQQFGQALREVAKVHAMGSNKHGEYSWQNETVEAQTDALARHLTAEGHELRDQESGLFHAAHIAWRALSRLELLIREEEAADAVADTEVCFVYEDEDTLGVEDCQEQSDEGK